MERSGKAAQESTADAAQGMPPKPSVKIDNQTDPFATVVSIKYGNKLGELLDTVSGAQGACFHAVAACKPAPAHAQSSLVCRCCLSEGVWPLPRRCLQAS